MPTEEQNKLWAETKVLIDERDALQVQLNGLYEIKYHDIPLPPGRTDIKASEENSYKTRECTNPELAAQLEQQIEELKAQIEPLVAKYNQLEGERRYQEAEKGKHAQLDKMIAEAKENAQHRYSRMSKFKKAMTVITGQRKKFDQLIANASNLSTEEKQSTIEQIDQFYRGK